MKVVCYFNAKDKYIGSCYIAELLYKNSEKSFILLDTDSEVDFLDKKLWSFKKVSFLSHDREEKELISLGSSLEKIKLTGYKNIINISEKIISLGSKQTIIEIVSKDEEDKTASRSKCLKYKDLGYSISFIEFKEVLRNEQ